jgi:hypothetical protein
VHRCQAAEGGFRGGDGAPRGDRPDNIRAVEPFQSVLFGAQVDGSTGRFVLSVDKLAGVAVHTGARIAALPGPGELLASRTFKDLVAGSEIRFEASRRA